MIILFSHSEGSLSIAEPLRLYCYQRSLETSLRFRFRRVTSFKNYDFVCWLGKKIQKQKALLEACDSLLITLSSCHSVSGRHWILYSGKTVNTVGLRRAARALWRQVSLIAGWPAVPGQWLCVWIFLPSLSPVRGKYLANTAAAFEPGPSGGWRKKKKTNGNNWP